MKILVISDPHGNTDALREVLDNTSGYEYVWFRGKYVDYGHEADLVIEIVQEQDPNIVLVGNHDYVHRIIPLKLLINEQLKMALDPSEKSQSQYIWFEILHISIFS